MEEEYETQSHEMKHTSPIRRIQRHRNLTTQSDENVNTEFTTEKTTVFIDTNPIHEAMPDDRDDGAFNNAPPVDLPMLIERPYTLEVFSWLPAWTEGTSVFSTSMPANILANTILYQRISNIAFWRPDFEITIRVNGTPMHYGRLVFCWIPQASLLDSGYKYYQNAFSNRWYQVSASSQQTVKFTVPFTFYKQHISTQNPEELFVLYCYVAAPLQSVNATAAPIEVNVFGRIKNPRFAGYRLTTQGDDSPINEVKTTNTVVSSTLRKMSDWAKLLIPVPGIGMYVSPISILLKAGGDLAEMLGFGIPLNKQPIQPMAVRAPRLATVKDCPDSVIVGASYTACLDKSLAGVNGKTDELTVLGFASRPALLYFGTIASTYAVDTVLWRQNISPGLLYYSNYTTPTNPAAAFPLPITWISNFANLWRGGIKFHFSFISSQFHSCRVRLTYIPFFNEAAPAITYGNELECMNLVMDITRETEYSIVVPYMQETDWLSVGNEFDSIFPQFQFNGQLVLTLLNTLTSGSTVVNPIYFQIFASAAGDFQLAYPTTTDLAGRGSYFGSTTFDLTTQGIDVKECELPSSSFECLMHTKHTSITTRDAGIQQHRVTTSFELYSLKQLCNMLTPAFNGNTNGYFVMNFPGQEGLSITNTAAYNTLLQMFTVFRYWKGGIRVSIPLNCNGVTIQAFRQYNSQVLNTTMLQTTAASDLTFSNNYYVEGAVIQPVAELGSTDLVYPYYSRNNCYLTACGSGSSFGAVAATDQTTNFLNVYLTSTATPLLNYTVAIGGADDLVIGFQIGIPISAKYAVPPIQP